MRTRLGIGLVLGLASCGGGGGPNPCTSNDECVLDGVDGTCRPSPASSSSWCSYPDPSCDSGDRWSSLAGDGLADVCVVDMTPDAGIDAAIDAAEPDATQPLLSVTREGTGGGTVTSVPSGIDCGASCDAGFMPGTMVTLMATPDVGNTFQGWGGDCSGMGTCMVTMDSDRQVTADFSAPPGEKLWLRQFGSVAGDQVAETVTDSAGDIIIAGTFGADIDFGGSFTEMSAGSTDVFIAKLSRTTGDTIWEIPFGGTGEEWVEIGLTVDASDNVLVTGRFSSATATVGTMPVNSNGGGDVFVIKLAGADGTPMWATSFGDAGLDRGKDVATDSTENVYVIGTFNSTSMTVGLDTVNTNGNGDILFFKLAGADGAPIWAKNFGAAEADDGVQIAVDGFDDVVVAGTFRLTVDFEGTTPLMSAGSDDIFLGKYDSDGGEVWSTRFGGSGADNPASLDLNGSDQITMAGRFDSPTFTLGGDVFDPVGTSAMYVGRISVGGNHLWSAMFESTGNAVVGAVAVAPLGDVYLGGGFNGSLNLGGGAMVSAGGGTSYDIFVGRFDGSDATHEYSRKYGGADLESSTSLTITTDRVVVCGNFSGIAEFQDEALTSVGMGDGYCLALAP